MNLNKMVIAGRLPEDAIVSYTSNGQARFNCRIITNSYYRDSTSGERKSVSETTHIVAWDKIAERMGKFAFAKGQRLYVEGKKQTRSYEVNGQRDYIVECKVSDFQSIEKNEARDNYTNPANRSKSQPNPNISQNNGLAPQSPMQNKPLQEGDAGIINKPAF